MKRKPCVVVAARALTPCHVSRLLSILSCRFSSHGRHCLLLPLNLLCRLQVWQHCDCMGVVLEEYSDERAYLCEECDERDLPVEIEVIPQPPNAPPGHTFYLTLKKDSLLVKQGTRWTTCFSCAERSHARVGSVFLLLLRKEQNSCLRWMLLEIPAKNVHILPI